MLQSVWCSPDKKPHGDHFHTTESSILSQCLRVHLMFPQKGDTLCSTLFPRCLSSFSAGSRLSDAHSSRHSPALVSSSFPWDFHTQPGELLLLSPACAASHGLLSSLPTLLRKSGRNPAQSLQEGTRIYPGDKNGWEFNPSGNYLGHHGEQPN